MEGNETEEETARREVFEEIGLRPQFLYGFREKDEYERYEDPEAEPTVTYSDGNGNALTKEEFEQAVANWAIGKTMDDYAFEWKEVRAQG